jgi:hypothetical protein
MGRKVNLERLALVVIAAVALAGFVVSPAFGGPGFLTKKKADKLYLKKNAAKALLSKGEASGLYLSKAEADGRFYSRSEADARTYSKGEADGRFLRPEGAIRIASGPTNWVLGPTFFEEPDPKVTYFADATRLRSSAAVTAAAQMMPDLPATLYGRATKIAGAELCYDASSTARLASVILEAFTESDGISAPVLTTSIVEDNTLRTDNNCRTYTASTPVALGPGDYVALVAVVNYSTASQSDFLLGRATFLLQP